MNKKHQFHSANAISAAPLCGITELIIPNSTPEYAALLMPMIAYITQSSKNRWVTWIAPLHVTRDFLESYGVNTHCLRLIHCCDEARRLSITDEALTAGNSHTVISSPGKLTAKELRQLEFAATKGQCQGLLLRIR